MTPAEGVRASADTAPRRVFHVNGGFLWQRRVRRILHLAGHDLRLGWPGAQDRVAVWGKSPVAARGARIAARTGAGLLHVEDAFLRSVRPGRSGAPPLGLLIDRQGVHFDAGAPSDLEDILARDPLDDTPTLERARAAIARLRAGHLTKYSGVDAALPGPDPGYVLVIDQAEGDASVRHGGAQAATFAEMLACARAEHPHARILIKTHPETAQGHRKGHFAQAEAGARVRLLRDPLSPWALLDGAIAVYTVSSQMGFEAILAGHRPQVFGRPFYAGWGLTADRHPTPFARRGRRLTPAQLFAGAMILYPTWYDPCRDRLCDLEGALAQFEADTRTWREDRRGWSAHGMRLWKRAPVQRFFGAQRRVIFGGPRAGRPAMVWASAMADAPEGATRVEDGFLRSRGLGADLVPPLSLVLDDLGIYYDPARESRLERLITARERLRPDEARRARALVETLTRHRLSKYNLGGPAPALPKGHRILVPGQVEDDAAIRLGAGHIATNLALLDTVRRENPEAVILYKPHPDVAAGLRAGAVPLAALAGRADMVVTGTDPAALLAQVAEVWTMTSTLGFEALLRGVPVTTTGAPFYAGWGLTRDLGTIPVRRRARPTPEGLVHAALIDYPRYRDPLSGLPCPVEVVAERLADGTVPRAGAATRLLAKVQGALAGHAWLWR